MRTACWVAAKSARQAFAIKVNIRQHWLPQQPALDSDFGVNVTVNHRTRTWVVPEIRIPRQHPPSINSNRRFAERVSCECSPPSTVELPFVTGTAIAGLAYKPPFCLLPRMEAVAGVNPKEGVLPVILMDLWR